MGEVNPGCYNEQANLQAIVNLQQGAYGTPLQVGLNLSDVADKAAARVNLGITSDGTNILIGNFARFVPLASGFKIQVSTDGVTWQDGPTHTAS